MYPSSLPQNSNDRVKVDCDSAAFRAGTQARTFFELSIPAGGAVYVRMDRPVDIIVRNISVAVNAGEIRMEVYRSPTMAGTWGTNLPVFAKNETAFRPLPLYVPQVTLRTGGTFTGGAPYDLLDIVTATASAQQATVGGQGLDNIGAPKDSTGGYKFINPGNSTSKGVLTIWWEELPIL